MDWRRTTRPARGSDIWGVTPDPDAGKEPPEPKKRGALRKVLALVFAIAIIAAAIAFYMTSADPGL